MAKKIVVIKETNGYWHVLLVSLNLCFDWEWGYVGQKLYWHFLSVFTILPEGQEVDTHVYIWIDK